MNCVCCEKRLDLGFQDYMNNSDNDLNYFCHDCRLFEIVCSECKSYSTIFNAVKNDWWIHMPHEWDDCDDWDLCGNCREKNYQETCGKRYNKYCQRCNREYNAIEVETCEKCIKSYNIGDGDICKDCHDKIH
jgi:hypothetical protein